MPALNRRPPLPPPPPSSPAPAASRRRRHANPPPSPLLRLRPTASATHWRSPIARPTPPSPPGSPHGDRHRRWADRHPGHPSSALSAKLIMGSSWAILLLFCLASVFASGAMAATFVFRNRCREPIYPGVQTNPGRPAFPTTGFELRPGAEAQFHGVAGTWAGRIWPRHRCSAAGAGGLSCASGDCAGRLECNGAGNQPPSTLAEFTLGGDGGKDFYDISNVDGFNVPLQISPVGAGCSTVTCGADITAACPPELAVKAADGSAVGCKSACLAFNTDEYCCRGAFGTPDRCRPSRYSEFFKAQCPQAYSYAYDDRTSTFTCATGANYNIVFCP